MKEEECLFCTSLKEIITDGSTWKGIVLKPLIIRLDENINAKWDAFREKILKYNEARGFFFAVSTCLYWFKIEYSHPKVYNRWQSCSQLKPVLKLAMYVLTYKMF